MNIVGTISFGKRTLDVYSSVNTPLFKASDVADMIDYSSGNVWKMLEMCFGWSFSWSMATGVYIIICILKSIFSHHTTVKK